MGRYSTQKGQWVVGAVLSVCDYTVTSQLLKCLPNPTLGSFPSFLYIPQRPIHLIYLCPTTSPKRKQLFVTNTATIKTKRAKKLILPQILTICTMGTCLDLQYVGTNNIAKWPTILQKSDSRKTKAATDFYKKWSKNLVTLSLKLSCL